MAFPRLYFRLGGLHLPELGLWMDPHEPVVGSERVFVSHAHSDHTAAHREVILSEPTSRLMQARVPGQRLEHVLNFGERHRFDYRGVLFHLTLVPAGHIFGSAMALVEAGGETLLYTGDFKLRKGLSAEPCEPRPADILVMETTFGRPEYKFPPTAAVISGVIRFCREALDNEETPVLLGYSLGKSQELLCSLGEAGLPIVLHGTVYRLTRIYEQFGHCFPPYDPYEAGTARGKVLLCPPSVVNSAMLRRLGRTRSAILTGWAVDPNCRYRYQCDAAFPISDHADFTDLLEFVRQVQPKQVYTLHGFSSDFARTLRDHGFNAQALNENEQLGLALGDFDSPPSKDKKRSVEPGAVNPAPAHPEPHPDPVSDDRSGAFGEFSGTCSRIVAQSGKLEKVRILAGYLSSLDDQSIGFAATWFSGRPFPSHENKVLQLGWAVLRDALCNVAGVDAGAFHQVYLKHSDLGETACELLQARSIPERLTLSQVDQLFHSLHAARGPRAKAPLLARALQQCSGLEAKYLVKIITGDLRIGLKEGLVEEAVAKAFQRELDDVRQAHLLVGEIGETARLAARGQLSAATIVPFRPIKFMLASPEETAADLLARVESWTPPAKQGSEAPNQPPGVPAPAGAVVDVWLEDKYDGIRCQLHKVRDRVALYSRDLKNISDTFPELVHAAAGLSADVILDGEILASRGEEVLPFAELQKRLGRRENDLFMREEIPIRFMAFDLLWKDGLGRLDLPLRERRAALETLIRPSLVGLARVTPAATPEDIELAFAAARARGNEGLMAKDPNSKYTPGRRGLAWLKLKKALATLDCVVVGAEYGHGKRAKVLSDYTFAVRDDETGELKTIGKAYSGLTDREIEMLTERFLRTARRQHGRYYEVPPDTVLEIAFDRIQPSTRHSSGLAMRFPRIVRIRDDKTAADIDTVASARRLVSIQQPE